MAQSNRVFAWHMSPELRPLTPTEVDAVSGAGAGDPGNDGIITIGTDNCSTYTQAGDAHPDDEGHWDELDC